MHIMKLANSIPLSLALIFGSAIASETIDMESETDVSASYAVDEDHDGRTDHTLELEQSDSLA